MLLPMAQQIQIDEVYLLDCRDGMRLMADASVDLIVTDPPFAIGFKAQRSNYNRTGPRLTISVGREKRGWGQRAVPGHGRRVDDTTRVLERGREDSY